MSNDYEDDLPDMDDYILKTDVDKLLVDSAAEAINEFLYLIGCGYSPQASFERSMDNAIITRLFIPSNVHITATILSGQCRNGRLKSAV